MPVWFLMAAALSSNLTGTLVSDLDCFTAVRQAAADPHVSGDLKSNLDEAAGYYFGHLVATAPRANWIVQSEARRAAMAPSAGKTSVAACYATFAAVVRIQAAALPTPAAIPARPSRQQRSGPHTVYSPSECVGAVVNGICHGSILPNGGPHQVCHGEMLNGACTGPTF